MGRDVERHLSVFTRLVIGAKRSIGHYRLFRDPRRMRPQCLWCAGGPSQSMGADGYLRSLSAVAASDPPQSVEVDFLLLLPGQIRPAFRYRLRPADVPHHRKLTRTPAIHPTNNAASISADQIGNRDAFTFIIVNFVLSSCTEALRNAPWGCSAFTTTARRTSLILAYCSSIRE